ncbi:MAG: hypothetical protein A2015_13455 [Spirochaetes bacterium GWF1_31_7]|nr:MAG: hypothetical protein A2Y30_11370 [Spirochaetes bacterium GWE1_32_154]OHD47946.1 MAG: hypothetical protein A2Y29_08190 [Spirochaetes bacterium GWE2_31_10]OHD49829.1 MAG: hypothetical protein A2015_13455 [Spirochaetes bacterium GWF1_31_7]OHD82233.1 MAG: hypothetical protein A2355_11355 [Spirochaetes bacterium RIFOXYB1_FULL_32_8]HBD92926.1 hypothetical protein [Spirochaetia bacterium]
MITKSNDVAFEQAMKAMERKIRDISETVSANIIPETKQMLIGNIFKTIVVAFTIGLISGLMMSLFGRHSGKRK